MKKKILTVVIADDHEIFLKGLKQTLEEMEGFQVLAVAGNGIELVAQCRLHQPDIVFTDIKMPGLNGPAATRQIMELLPQTIVLALSMYEDDHTIIDILTAGARGFIKKGARSAEIAAAVKQLSSDDRYYCGSGSVALHSLIKKYSYKRLPVNALLCTKREREVIQLLCEGFSTNEIAEKLFITPTTVSGHRSSLLKKTGSKNTPGILLYAFQNGLYEDPGKED
ncbi:MAG: response regulator transcription factor [Chitinophagaceae bacterium]|nr:MAG: response regulator transcription factor [Chitinophagaceae bacterium]